MTAISADGRVLVTYNGSQSQWQAWHYNEGAAPSHIVNVSTSGNEVGNFTNIIVWSNQTHLSIYRNGTQGQIKNITTDNITSAPVDAQNWDGRLEEVRTFDRALDSTNRTAIVNNPVEQQPNFSTTSRIMFDQPDKSTQLILYADADLQQSNVSFSAGFAEQVMQPKTLSNDLAGTTDYNWQTDGPRLAPTAGGELDGAPVAYASYDYNTALSKLVTGWGDFMTIAALIPIIAIGLVFVAKLRGF
jgi:hypothetical protein